MLRDVLQVILRRTTGRTDRGRTTTTGRDERRGYPIISKKYIDGLRLETDTHRHFQTSNKSVNRCTSFCKHMLFAFILYLLCIFFTKYIFEIFCLIHTLYYIYIYIYICVHVYIFIKFCIYIFR